MYRPGGCQKALAFGVYRGCMDQFPFCITMNIACSGRHTPSQEAHVYDRRLPHWVLCSIPLDQHHRRLLWSMRFIWHHQWMCDSWGVFVKMSPVWTSVHRKRSIPVRGCGDQVYIHTVLTLGSMWAQTGPLTHKTGLLLKMTANYTIHG